MAQGEGFEPSSRVTPTNALAGRRNQPTLPPLQIIQIIKVERKKKKYCDIMITHIPRTKKLSLTDLVLFFL